MLLIVLVNVKSCHKSNIIGRLHFGQMAFDQKFWAPNETVQCFKNNPSQGVAHFLETLLRKKIGGIVAASVAVFVVVVAAVVVAVDAAVVVVVAVVVVYEYDDDDSINGRTESIEFYEDGKKIKIAN